MKKHFDLTNVVAAFLAEQYPERAELVSELGAALRAHARPVQYLIAQVAHESVSQPGCTPAMTIEIGLLYGLALGVLLERDRLDREVVYRQ
jgi:hypothetical protein